MVNLLGRLKNIKPRHRVDFIKGFVLRWDDYATTRRVPNQKQKRDIAISIDGKGIDKEKALATGALKSLF